MAHLVAVDDLVTRVTVDSHIHHLDRNAEFSREYAGSVATAGDEPGPGSSHPRWLSGHLRGRDTMIGCEENKSRVADRSGWKRSLATGQPDTKITKSAEGA